MAKHVPMHIKSGIPYGRTITVTLPAGRDWWLDDIDFEVLSQIREASDSSSPLILDLVQFMTVSFDGINEVSIDLKLNGEDTRKVKSGGYYDIVISDVFAIDERAFTIVEGPVYRTSLVTSDSEVVV
jgi:hypothetical protein